MVHEFLGPEAIYRQIASILRARIERGTYPPGHAIPSTAALCAEFEVSHKTVRAAVRVLVDEGLVVTAHGRGVYVTDAATGSTPPAGR